MTRISLTVFICKDKSIRIITLGFLYVTYDADNFNTEPFEYTDKLDPASTEFAKDQQKRIENHREIMQCLQKLSNYDFIKRES